MPLKFDDNGDIVGGDPNTNAPTPGRDYGFAGGGGGGTFDGPSDALQQFLDALEKFNPQFFEASGNINDIANQFLEFANNGDPVIDAQRQAALATTQEDFARSGLGSSSAGQNAAARVRGQYDVLELDRRNQNLTTAAGLFGDALDPLTAGLENLLAPEQLDLVRQAIEANAGGGGGGGGFSVICTELHRRGAMSEEVFAADNAYGKTVPREVLAGYHFWARPLVRAMQRHRWVYLIVRPFGLAWANHIAGEKNWLGALLMQVGVPWCWFIGKCLQQREVAHG